MWPLIFCTLFTVCTFNLIGFNALAQFCQAYDSPVEDTLNSKGYYPLEIGNRWEYVADLNFALDSARRVEVVKDTLVNDTLFYKLEIRRYRFENTLGYFGDQIIEQQQKSYRFESVVDGKLVSFFRDRIIHQGIEFNRPFCSEYVFDGFTDFIIDGGYGGAYLIQIGTETLSATVPALKSYGCCFGSTTYGYGIGKIETHGDPSLKTGLVYAKLDTTEFGLPLDSLFSVSAVATEKELEFSQTHNIDISPNPLMNRGVLHIEMHTRGIVTVVVTDILGREKSKPIHAVLLQSGEHRVNWLIDGYQSGVYFLQLYVNGFRTAIKKAIVIN